MNWLLLHLKFSKMVPINGVKLAVNVSLHFGPTSFFEGSQSTFRSAFLLCENLLNLTLMMHFLLLLTAGSPPLASGTTFARSVPQLHWTLDPVLTWPTFALLAPMLVLEDSSLGHKPGLKWSIKASSPDNIILHRGQHISVSDSPVFSGCFSCRTECHLCLTGRSVWLDECPAGVCLDLEMKHLQTIWLSTVILILNHDE